MEEPGRRAAQQEAKRAAEALKEEQRKAKRDAQNEKYIQAEKRRIDRYVKQAKVSRRTGFFSFLINEQ